MRKFVSRHQKRIMASGLIVMIAVLNIFKIRFGFDLIVVTMAILALIKGESSEFVRDWFVPVILFFLYEFLRGHAYLVGNNLFGWEPVYQQIINIESNLFFFMNDIPTVYLQQTLRPDLGVIHWYDYVLFFFYTSFFWYWVAVGFVIWLKKRNYFKRYIYGLIGFSMVAVVVYFFLPTAPPWAASESGLLPPLQRILWTSQYLPSNSIDLVSTYGRNDFAAIPSLHAAWPMFASLFLIKAFGKKMLPSLLMPLIIAFATWYGAEHYVIDSLIGFGFAGVAFWIATKAKN